MAQPIYENGPLDDYLREADLDLFPGILPEFMQHECTDYDLPEWLPSIVPSLVHSFASILYIQDNEKTTRQFAERFKYMVISSSLLSVFLAAPDSAAETTRVDSLHHQNHEPLPSATTDERERKFSSDQEQPPSTLLALSLIILIPIALATGHYFRALLLLLFAKLYTKTFITSIEEDSSVNRVNATLLGLQSLVDADTAWESGIGEAMLLLRQDEASGLSAHSPSALRVAVHCSLQAINTQSDRVRQLFSPLTSPEELSQMSEMYAPPSPPSGLHIFTHDQTTPPYEANIPGAQLRRTLSGSFKSDKRITWSGSSPSRIRDSTHQKSPSPLAQSASSDAAQPLQPAFDENSSFGALALDLRRSRTATVARVSQPFSSPSSLRTSPSSGAARFTSMHATRSPLSSTALSSTLHKALSSKRYAASHLLALRFDEDEDDQYWEDVRSVMGLLASSLEDECERLNEALGDWHRSRERDARPSISASADHSPLVTSLPPIPGAIPPSSKPSPITPRKSLPSSPTVKYSRPLPPRRNRPGIPSFAPQETESGKFLGHMEHVDGALERAHEDLEKCILAYQQYSLEPESDERAQLVVAVFDGLRRELGIAFRECERSRSLFLSTLKRDGEDDRAEPPLLSPLSTSLALSSPPRRDFQLDSPPRGGASSPPPAYVSRGPSQIVDDVTAHLLAGATAQHLPPPGADRVFEADSGAAAAVGGYSKERSTLSRQERIALVQAKRKSAQSPRSPTSPRGGALQPLFLSGDVVQELREVINKVNERKQRYSLQPLPPSLESAETPSRRESSVSDTTLQVSS